MDWEALGQLGPGQQPHIQNMQKWDPQQGVAGQVSNAPVVELRTEPGGIREAGRDIHNAQLEVALVESKVQGQEVAQRELRVSALEEVSLG